MLSRDTDGCKSYVKVGRMYDVECNGSLSFDSRIVFVRGLFEKWHDLKWTGQAQQDSIGEDLTYLGMKEQRAFQAAKTRPTQWRFLPFSVPLSQQLKSKLHSCGAGAVQLAGDY